MVRNSTLMVPFLVVELLDSAMKYMNDTLVLSKPVCEMSELRLML